MEIKKRTNKRNKKGLIILLIAALTISIVPLFASAASVPAVKNLQATSPAKKKIRLTWDSVKGRSYYTIIAKCDGETYKKGTYKVKSNKYTFTGVPRGHKYSFKVRVYKKGKKSAARTVDFQLGIILSRPEITGKSNGYKRNDISWKTVKDATGYKVIETDLETGITTKQTCKKDDLQALFYSRIIGRQYSYKVRAYAKDYGEKVWSDWSKEITVTTKKTRIGQASSDYDKVPGDGNGKEVAASSWGYSSSSTSYRNWTYVFRFKDSEKAEVAATMMETAIANDNIGYHGNYDSVQKRCRELAKEYNYDLSKITEKTGCACGGIVSLCVKATGINLDISESGLGVAKRLEALPDDFKCYTAAKYVSKEDYLQRGDILITAHSNGKNNHVCMVL